jgi:hypothetical protein
VYQRERYCTDDLNRHLGPGVENQITVAGSSKSDNCDRFLKEPILLLLRCPRGEWMLVEEAMTPAAQCRRMAAMLRAKADRESDPEARAEWKCIARGYLILATQFERSNSEDIILSTIREIDEKVI